MKFFHKMADLASYWLGTPQSFIFHLTWWVVWIGFKVEPYPFNFLTMVVSLEAIIFGILILNSDTRQGRKDRKMVQRDLDIDDATHTLVSKIWEKLSE